jgi:hypothetical protein
VYDLISEEEYAALPEDNEQCFVDFEAICRRNMMKMLDRDANDISDGFERTIKSQYMMAVSAVADECGISNLSIRVVDRNDFYPEFDRFSLAVHGEVARIRVRKRSVRNRFSVQLAPNTRTKIDHYISRIREAIDGSDLGPDRKQSLYEKLDELTAELGKPRLSFAKTMLLLSGVMAGLSGAVTIAADAPDAVSNIVKLIGLDRETEDAAALRLTAPPKALPAPAKKAPVTSSTEFDDDIPF